MLASWLALAGSENLPSAWPDLVGSASLGRPPLGRHDAETATAGGRERMEVLDLATVPTLATQMAGPCAAGAAYQHT